MRTLTLAAVLVLARGLHPMAAQHGVLAGASGGGECDLCHASHNRGTGAYALKGGEGGGWYGRTGTETLGPSSQSCLRCHGVAQVRRRQPEFSRAMILDGPAPSYLGFDFSDDHPVGSAGHVQAPGAGVRGRASRTRLTPGGALEVERRGLECTRCHDPHDRRGATPQVEDEPGLCGQCHEVAGSGATHQALPCSSCHRVHGGAVGRLLRNENADLVCRSCHDSRAGAPQEAERRAVPYPAPQAHARDPRPPAGPCLNCHAAHR